MAEEQQKETASQKYRRKLKENPELHADHLRRERARDSKRREIMKKKMEADEDLKILARIRSKERMQTTRKRRREEQIKQIGTRYKSGKKMTQYRYVGLCQSDVDEDGEIRIQFLTTINGKRFTEIVNDIADVKFEDIIAKLEAPEKKTDGNNIIIEFSQNIDVFEKK